MTAHSLGWETGYRVQNTKGAQGRKGASERLGIAFGDVGKMRTALVPSDILEPRRPGLAPLSGSGGGTILRYARSWWVLRCCKVPSLRDPYLTEHHRGEAPPGQQGAQGKDTCLLCYAGTLLMSLRYLAWVPRAANRPDLSLKRCSRAGGRTMYRFHLRRRSCTCTSWTREATKSGLHRLLISSG